MDLRLLLYSHLHQNGTDVPILSTPNGPQEYFYTYISLSFSAQEPKQSPFSNYCPFLHEEHHTTPHTPWNISPVLNCGLLISPRSFAVTRSPSFTKVKVTICFAPVLAHSQGRTGRKDAGNVLTTTSVRAAGKGSGGGEWPIILQDSQ